MSYVLIDIGATMTRLTVSPDAREYDTVHSFKTSASYTTALKKIQTAFGTSESAAPIAVVVGIRGQLDDSKETLVHDTILSDWLDKPLADDLAEMFGAPVHIENNAALAGLGEAVYGAGQGHDVVVYHTISTGVGGAKIESGMIAANRGCFEPGQQILDIDHTILGEDVEPTLESLVSARAITERMNTDPSEIEQSDALWDQLAYFLAHGLRNSILYWSPDAIVLGGPMILGTPHIPLANIIEHTNEVMGEVTEVPLILAGSLGDEAGLKGALAYINKQL